MKSLSAVALTLLVLALLPLRADDADAHYVNNGYSLLYKLCDQEKPLDQILIVKTTPKEVAEFLHQVSAAAGSDVDQLETLRDHDKAIRFDQRGLGQFEEDTRGSIQADKQHLLLFGTTGSSFARALLVTQIEASTYGSNLAQVLAAKEPNAHRAAVVRQIGEKWKKITARAYALLNAQ